ncbi:cohesin domain-containing protein [Lewinella sp. W8]|uniref:cohesin domain-containing protein n=1 Tax=Lewinella sp. W8 TaxID=2528208 RepID=UPI001068AB3C|nr:cohesin domain-containing protein [Lewinella sp. W8]MTB53950.1 hypothetical protein [Lewinella sp. W8]
MKHLITSLLFLIFFAGHAFGQDTLRLEVNDVMAEVIDSTLQIPVTVHYPDSVGGIQFALNFPDAVIQFDTLVFGPSVPENFSANFNQNEDNEVRVVLAPGLPEVPQLIFTEDSVLLTLSFHITENFTSAAAITFNADFVNVAIDMLGNEIPTVVEGGEISVIIISTHDLSFPEPLKLYPNPSRGQVMLEGLSDHQRARVRLFDVRGVLLWQAVTGPQLRFPAEIPPGSYFLWVQQGQFSQALKVQLRP